MNVKNTIPKYTKEGERDIIVQRKYSDIQRLIYENQKMNESKKKEEKKEEEKKE